MNDIRQTFNPQGAAQVNEFERRRSELQHVGQTPSDIEPTFTASRAFEIVPAQTRKPDTEAHKVACIASYIDDASRLAKFTSGLAKASTRMQGYHDTAEMLEAAARRLRELKPDGDRPKTAVNAPPVRPDDLPVPLCLAWKTWTAETFED